MHVIAVKLLHWLYILVLHKPVVLSSSTSVFLNISQVTLLCTNSKSTSKFTSTVVSRQYFLTISITHTRLDIGQMVDSNTISSTNTVLHVVILISVKVRTMLGIIILYWPLWLDLHVYEYMINVNDDSIKLLLWLSL